MFFSFLEASGRKNTFLKSEFVVLLQLCNKKSESIFTSVIVGLPKKIPIKPNHVYFLAYITFKSLRVIRNLLR